MLQQFFDPNYHHFGTPEQRRKVRQYPREPLQTRLDRWIKKVFPRTQSILQTKEVITLQMRQSLADALGLPDNWVTLSSDGVLRHHSRDEPLVSHA